MAKSVAVVFVLAIGLLVVFRPDARRESRGSVALGNCYSDASSYDTPTLCE
jgi:hypothetical protein